MTAIEAVADAISLVAPVDCAGCGALDRALCRLCAATLQPRPLRGNLGRVGGRDVLAGPAGFAAELPVVAGLPYDGVARRVVLALKEEGRTELAARLAPALTVAVEAAWRGTAAELLVPVPGSRAGRARRGFDPVTVLLQRAGLRATPALCPRGLGSRERAQKSRTLAERGHLEPERWRVDPRVSGRRVVIVDDVVTSGATLRTAALALTRAGAEVVGCTAVAATPRRTGASSIPWQFLARDHESHGDKVTAQDYRGRKEA